MGAGRPGGVTTAGRALRTVARELLADLVGTKKDPLLIAIEIAADESNPAPLRLEAALGCAKFLHPTLSAQAVAHISKPSNSNQALATIMERFERLTSQGQTIDGVPAPAEKAVV